MMINLSGQSALVVGGSRGIGAATALLLAEAGADVCITYHRDRKSAESVIRLIRRLDRDACSVKCRVEDPADCRRVVAAVMKRFGRIDILVNSAGIWEYGAVGAISPRAWERSIAVNLNGTFFMCNAVVPEMKKRHYGRIINVSSTAGQRGEAFHAHYAASKGGVLALTRSMAVELVRDGIWVNAIAPGWVDTDMVSDVMKKEKRKISYSIPRGSIATPKEIAGPILFLASSLANHCVGVTLNVNGGSVL
jgi:3-oxoacyl-[acyl-carrier protein] reductase